MAPEHQVGYHIIALPLIRYAYVDGRFGSSWLKRAMEHLAKRRTKDIRAEMKGLRRDRIGRIERAILEPLCYGVGYCAMRLGIAAPDVSYLPQEIAARVANRSA